MRAVIAAVDPDGQEVALISLGNSPEPAKALPETLAKLEAAGVSWAWFLHSDGQGREYVRVKHKGRVVTVARLIAQASNTEQVKFRDDDRLNLREDNLQIIRITRRNDERR